MAVYFHFEEPVLQLDKMEHCYLRARRGYWGCSSDVLAHFDYGFRKFELL